MTAFAAISLGSRFWLSVVGRRHTNKNKKTEKTVTVLDHRSHLSNVVAPSVCGITGIAHIAIRSWSRHSISWLGGQMSFREVRFPIHFPCQFNHLSLSLSLFPPPFFSFFFLLCM
jgi:hypothetical protein